LRHRTLTPFAQRALVIVSKIIQSVANQVEFDNEKEQYMIAANDIIQGSMPQMLGFLNNLINKIESSGM